MKKGQTPKHYLLLKVADNVPPIRLGVRAKRAKQKVVLNRRISDLQAGTEGLSITCANSQCALRENSQAFPHPVYLAEFTDRRAYIVDKLDKMGTPISCVVYDHFEGEFQKQYDTKRKNTLVKMSGVEKSFTLYPPWKRLSGEGDARGRHNKPAGPKHGDEPSSPKRKAADLRGASARVKRAGINIPLQVKSG